MTVQVTVSKATYRILDECHKILQNSSLNITIVDLALFFLKHYKDAEK